MTSGAATGSANGPIEATADNGAAGEEDMEESNDEEDEPDEDSDDVSEVTESRSAGADVVHVIALIYTIAMRRNTTPGLGICDGLGTYGIYCRSSRDVRHCFPGLHRGIDCSLLCSPRYTSSAIPVRQPISATPAAQAQPTVTQTGSEPPNPLPQSTSLQPSIEKRSGKLLKSS